MVSLFQLLVAHIVCKIAAAFPQSQNPQMMTGPIETGKSMCQEIVILKNVSFTTYNQVISSNFTIPHCGANLAILSLQGQVSRGRQYDRFGAVWFDDIEVMRLTTPEPNNETNISWNVSQDISDYINIFTSQNIIARISIPNEVTDVYTGVIYINLILRLYKAQDMIMPATIATALVKPDFTDQDPLSSLSVNSGQSPGILSTNVSLDFAASQIKLRVLASAHGNEEFWYSNIPGDSSYKGIPGGGTFREILVTVDGIVAGTQPAFPYIYSGGLNPLAWRPLASIGQFAIPPYEFDLTPFAARLVSNCSITISIVSDDTEEDSIWYLSPSLLAWEYQQNTTLTEIDLTYAWLPASVVVLTQNSSNRTLFISEGHSNLYIRSITSVLTQEDIPREELITVEVNSTVTIANTNHLIGNYTQRTTAIATSESILSLRRAYIGEIARQTKILTKTDVYPLHVELFQNDTSSSLFIQANISESRRRSVIMQNDSTQYISWNNSIKSNATLTDLQSGGIDLGFATTNASFHISSSPSTTCFSREATATNGFLASYSKNTSYCTFDSPELRFCGLDLCGVEAWFYNT